MECETFIRVFYKTAAGYWEEERDDFALSDFAGNIPVAGDLILSALALRPSTPDRPSLGDPQQRTVYEVTKRFLRPEMDHEGRRRLFVALLCVERPATMDEINLL